MKTTYPKSFKARCQSSGEIIQGTLTVHGDEYGISFMSRVETALAHHDGHIIDISTLLWLCANCDTWNINNNNVCKHCNLKLGRCYE